MAGNGQATATAIVMCLACSGDIACVAVAVVVVVSVSVLLCLLMKYSRMPPLLIDPRAKGSRTADCHRIGWAHSVSVSCLISCTDAIRE